ncbi:hypothetical protein B0H21DRAFT_741227 [Amylocystis lapponica]|nr:hypothetical protein B0H21DRAFT_741227 [Amylocystis lapponica]
MVDSRCSGTSLAALTRTPGFRRTRRCVLDLKSTCISAGPLRPAILQMFRNSPAPTLRFVGRPLGATHDPEGCKYMMACSFRFIPSFPVWHQYPNNMALAASFFPAAHVPHWPEAVSLCSAFALSSKPYKGEILAVFSSTLWASTRCVRSDAANTSAPALHLDRFVPVGMVCQVPLCGPSHAHLHPRWQRESSTGVLLSSI